MSIKYDLYTSQFFQIYLTKLSVIGRVLYIFDVILVKIGEKSDLVLT